MGDCQGGIVRIRACDECGYQESLDGTRGPIPHRSLTPHLDFCFVDHERAEKGTYETAYKVADAHGRDDAFDRFVPPFFILEDIL